MRRKKKGGGLFWIILILLAAAGGYVYMSPSFERNPPKIVIENETYWNANVPLRVTISDDVGIMAYKITLQSGEKVQDLASEMLAEPVVSKSFELTVPSRSIGIKTESVTLHVEAKDGSNWNLFTGNQLAVDHTLQIDAQRPKVSIIANSYGIRRGGAAMVIFSAEDPHLKDLYIQSNFDKQFIPQPFYMDGYYVSLLAWPVTQNRFHAQIVARDEAGNVRKVNIPLHLKQKAYKDSKITLSDRFLGGKVTDLAQMFGAPANADALERFRFVNETLREKNEKNIHRITSRVEDEMVDSFDKRVFRPLKNAQKVASFGDHREYYYQGKKVSESYHLGLDLASVRMDQIVTQNAAKVVYSEDNGIYGVMPVLSHGLGLYTLYGHCSGSRVAVGETVDAGMHIANTGMSGYAMGDHLHFGVLVQGIEVRPEEWMDAQWIRYNVTDVIKDAKKIIDRRK